MRPQKKPPSCLYKYWTLWAFILPCLVVHVLWLAYAIKFNIWAQFQENYDISITVVFGALIAGIYLHSSFPAYTTNLLVYYFL